MPTPSPPAGGSPPSSIPAAQSKPLTLFDFTKRKRWLDLMLAELVDTLTFVISPTTKVIYCQCGPGGSVNEALGWAESDFVDCDLTDFINPLDQDHFVEDIQECLRTGEEGVTFARLRPNQTLGMLPPVEEVTYEFKTVPHTHPEQPEIQIVVVSAKQYFYRDNMAMAISIAQLKQENAALQARLKELRSQMSADVAEELAASMSSTDPSSSMYSSSNLSKPSESEAAGVSTDQQRETPVAAASQSGANHASPPEDQPEEGGKKKKVKKAHGVEQYVCVKCGRTDSPEWRKGPLGPKTLCNACGLRWAKQARKTDDFVDGRDSVTSVDSGTRRSKSPQS